MASKLGGHSLIRDPPTQESGGSFEFDPRTPQDRRHWLTVQSINQSVMPIMCHTVSNTIFCQIQYTHYKYLSTKLRQLITLTLKNEPEILTLFVPSQNISYPHKHHYPQWKHIKALCTLTVHNSRPFGKRPIRRKTHEPLYNRHIILRLSGHDGKTMPR